MQRAILFLFLVGGTAPLAAQGFCFRGRPKPKCSSFMITELTMRRTLRTVPDVDPIMDLELGVMANVGTRSAVGPVFVIGGTETDRTSGLGLRYRRWLTNRLAGEVELRKTNVCEPTGPGECGYPRGGFAAQGALTLSDYVGITVAFEHVNASSSRPSDPVYWSFPARSEWTAGVKFGSYATPVVFLGLGVLIAATW